MNSTRLSLHWFNPSHFVTNQTTPVIYSVNCEPDYSAALSFETILVQSIPVWASQAKARCFYNNPFYQFLKSFQTIHPSLSQAKGSYVIPSQTKKTLEKSEMVRTWFGKNPPNQSKSISASYAKANNSQYYEPS